jgi:hypothetical protein
MRSASVLCLPWKTKITTPEKRRAHLKNEGLASLQALDLLVAGTGFEPVTFGL